MENNLTAVEWLKLSLEHDSGMELEKWIEDLFKEAIEMEKLQMKNKIVVTSEDAGNYLPTIEEVQKMYDYLAMFFHRSQMNGLIEIDTHERNEIKKIIRLPENYR